MGNSRFPLNWKVHSTSGKPLKSAVESKREDTIGTLEEESRNCDDLNHLAISHLLAMCFVADEGIEREKRGKRKRERVTRGAVL